MSETDMITVDRLSKRYRLGGSHLAGGLRHWVNGLLPALIQGRGRQVANSPHSFWALKEVSLRIQPGEVVGIIGRNGAGKSTLLKILSRITPPTEGEARFRGRVASLLEVGTGFHHELTGRENIFLNGSILGMTRAEVKAKFDEIVAFSDIEAFLDTPVKHYSSGMYVRLAFAVAAHLEPEILLVDEVLAVGDTSFQKKCLGKMSAVARSGRTILFVSHNMSSIRHLCQRVIWLDGGQVRDDGPADRVTERYLMESDTARSLEDIPKLIAKLPPDPAIRFHSISIQQEGREGNQVESGKPIEIQMKYAVLSQTRGLRPYVVLSDTEGTRLFRSFGHSESEQLPILETGNYCSIVVIPADLLAPIRYELEISASIYDVRECFSEGIRVAIDVLNVGRMKHIYAAKGGIVFKIAPYLVWNTERID